MSIANLFVKKKNNIGGISFDGWIEEQHINEVVVTKNPVEFGADITDHAIIQPVKLTVRVIVTDTPLGLEEFVTGLVDNVSGIFGSSTEEGGTRSAQAYNNLVFIQNERFELSVQTGLKEYDNMIITSITAPVVKKQSVEMTIKLEQVLIVKSVTDDVPVDQLEDGTVAEQASSPSVDGRRQTQDIDPNSNKGKSVIKTLTDWVGIT